MARRDFSESDRRAVLPDPGGLRFDKPHRRPSLCSSGEHHARRLLAHGGTSPVRDPIIAHQGGTYYLFNTDPAPHDPAGYVPIRCSTDTTSWSACGDVFSTMPGWVVKAVPGVENLWAPDISYFNDQHHLYYAASTLHSQVSAIGLAATATLDRSSPLYQWSTRARSSALR